MGGSCNDLSCRPSWLRGGEATCDLEMNQLLGADWKIRYPLSHHLGRTNSPLPYMSNATVADETQTQRPPRRSAARATDHPLAIAKSGGLFSSSSKDITCNSASLGETGAETALPWICLHPSALRTSTCRDVSTPTATVSSPN